MTKRLTFEKWPVKDASAIEEGHLLSGVASEYLLQLWVEVALKSVSFQQLSSGKKCIWSFEKQSEIWAAAFKIQHLLEALENFLVIAQGTFEKVLTT